MGKLIRLQFGIRNMQFAKNERRLSRKLNKMPLFSSFVDHKLGMAIVECNEEKIKPLFIQKAIEQEGYKIHSCKQLLKE